MEIRTSFRYSLSHTHTHTTQSIIPYSLIVLDSIQAVAVLYDAKDSVFLCGLFSYFFQLDCVTVVHILLRNVFFTSSISMPEQKYDVTTLNVGIYQKVSLSLYIQKRNNNNKNCQMS